jgi:hypothetical protein
MPRAERGPASGRLPAALHPLQEGRALEGLTLDELNEAEQALWDCLQSGAVRGARRLRLHQWLSQVERAIWGRTHYGWLRPAAAAVRTKNGQAAAVRDLRGD